MAPAEALAILDTCLNWRPAPVSVNDLFRQIEGQNNDVSQAIGAYLADAVLPSVDAGDLGEERIDATITR